MNNLDAILEVAIGLVFVWLILSAATMEAQNVFGRIFQLRANFLEKSISDMFGGEKKYVDAFYAHPAIQELYRKGFLHRTKRPDYIPNPVFAEVAFEVFLNLGLGKNEREVDSISLQEIIDRVEVINDANPVLGYNLRRLLPGFNGEEIISKSRSFEQKAAEMKKNAEGWFDSSMTRASFWYKEKAQVIAFLLGLLIAFVINIDTVEIARQLWRDPTLRQTLVAQAEAMDIEGDPISVTDLEEYYKDINLPVGWTSDRLETTTCAGVSVKEDYLVVATEGGCYQVSSLPAFGDFWGWVVKLLGLTFSAFAAMQGAPFWFDMLRKLLDIKGGGSKSEEKEEKAPAPPPAPAAPPQYQEAVG